MWSITAHSSSFPSQVTPLATKKKGLDKKHGTPFVYTRGCLVCKFDAGMNCIVKDKRADCMRKRLNANASVRESDSVKNFLSGPGGKMSSINNLHIKSPASSQTTVYMLQESFRARKRITSITADYRICLNVLVSTVSCTAETNSLYYSAVQPSSGWRVTPLIRTGPFPEWLCGFYVRSHKLYLGGTNLSRIWQAPPPSVHHMVRVACLWHFPHCDCDSISHGPSRLRNDCVWVQSSLNLKNI